VEKKLMTLKGRLKWFLNFINARIEALSDREIFNFWMELRELAYGGLGVFAIPDEDLVKWREKKEQAKRIQHVLKNSLERILTISKKPKKTKVKPLFRWGDAEERAAEDIEKQGIPDEVGVALEAIISAEAEKKAIPRWANEYIALSNFIEMRVLAHGGRAFLFSTKPEDKLLLEFFTLLGQFQLSLIQQCQREDCGGYFLKATKKEKRYCSNRCAWVVASRERRKVQPEKEREKKRESYYTRIRREHGPHVKIHRRPKKEE
jgi:hypothetical protein